MVDRRYVICVSDESCVFSVWMWYYSSFLGYLKLLEWVNQYIVYGFGLSVISIYVEIDEWICY